MANRSDRNSKYPRELKRMLTLGYGTDTKRHNEVKKLFIEAHAAEIKFRQKALSRNDILGSDEETDTPMTLTKDKSTGAVLSK